MHMLWMLLCAQAVVEEAATSPAPCKTVRFMSASTTGAFLVVAEEAALHVLDGKTLQPLRKFALTATAVGFGEKDAVMTIVADPLLRVETQGWKETRRLKLPEAEFRGRWSSDLLPERVFVFEPGQALATPDGAVYYPSKGSHLSRAVLEGEEFKGEVLTRRRLDIVTEVDRVFCLAGPVAVVDGGGRAAVVFDGGEFSLAFSERPLGAALMAGRLALVGAGGESLYDLRTWKVKWTREAENLAAAFDVKRARVFCAGKAAVRFWSPEKPEEVGSFAGGFRALAIDGASTRLYGLDEGKLRAWTLKD